MGNGEALAFLDSDHEQGAPGTHVLAVGVGRYGFGKGKAESEVAGDLRQLSSPPISARALADWFTESFDNPDKPLHSVALVISEEPPQAYPRSCARAPTTPHPGRRARASGSFPRRPASPT